MPERERCSFLSRWESRALHPPSWAEEKSFESSSSEGLHTTLGMCVFYNSSKDLCDCRKARQGRWENRACVLSKESIWHLIQESVPPLFLQVLHIPVSEGVFLQLVVCWFGSACRIQWGHPCTAGGGEEVQQWCWECYRGSERLVQLLWSTLSSEGWKMFFYVIGRDSLVPVTITASSNTGETI